MGIQLIQAKEAVAYIKDNDTVAVDGFIGAVVPEEILRSVKEHCISTDTPKNLTFIYAKGVGSRKTRAIIM